MPGDAQADDEASRLEAALARIQAAARARPHAAAAAPQAPHDLAARLDMLIAELRALLAPPG